MDCNNCRNYHNNERLIVLTNQHKLELYTLLQFHNNISEWGFVHTDQQPLKWIVLPHTNIMNTVESYITSHHTYTEYHKSQTINTIITINLLVVNIHIKKMAKIMAITLYASKHHTLFLFSEF